jgi:catechol-2,3-dioxygenase
MDEWILVLSEDPARKKLREAQLILTSMNQEDKADLPLFLLHLADQSVSLA